VGEPLNLSLNLTLQCTGTQAASRARRFLRCIPTQVCFESLTRTGAVSRRDSLQQVAVRSHCILSPLQHEDQPPRRAQLQDAARSEA
jgi:hypothetical protein